MHKLTAVLTATALAFSCPTGFAAISSEELPNASIQASNTSAYSTDTTRPVLWQESFDSVGTGRGTNNQGPEGFKVETNELRSGKDQWKGWTWTNTNAWTRAAGTDTRHYFTRGHNSYAVADSKAQRLRNNETMNTVLRTPTIPLQQGAAFEFDSHYRQGSSENFAKVTAHFDNGQTQELLNLNSDKWSSHEVLPLSIPGGAQSVSFAFEYLGAQDDWFWAVDNLALTIPLAAGVGKPNAIVDVISDTHNASDKYARALNLLNAMPDPAGALVINGDFVDVGAQQNYDGLAADRKEHPHSSGREYFSIGNHEMYGKEGSDTYIKRFLDMTGQEHVWREEVVDGQPIITISTESYDDRARRGRGPFVVLSQEQLNWIDQRLAHWQSQNTPVLLFSHLVLPNTVSLTHSSSYHRDFADLHTFSGVVGKYQNIVMFTSHTHASFDLHDWWGTYRVDSTGNTAGFPVVNTGAVYYHTWPKGDKDESNLDGDHSTGLRVKTYPDRVRVEAWDFVSGGMIKYQDFPRVS